MLERITKQVWFEGLVDFVFPPLCLGCGEYYDDKTQICAVCISNMQPFDYPLCLNCRAFIPDGIECPVCKGDTIILFAYTDYQMPLKEIIHQFKFEGITSPSETFARLIYEKYRDRFAQVKANALIPIPLHTFRQSKRGYNQAELLARELSKFLGIPVDSDTLSRPKRAKEQARLHFLERIPNVRNAFTAEPTEGGAQKVILIDDVVTTGATVLEAKRILSESGREVVAVISIAHGL